MRGLTFLEDGSCFVGKHEYRPIKQSPAGIRFDSDRLLAGQIVQYEWGGPENARSEHGPGSPYLRVFDQSDGELTFYRRCNPPSRTDA